MAQTRFFIIVALLAATTPLARQANGRTDAAELSPPPPSPLQQQPTHCLAYLVQVFSCLPYLTYATPAPPTICCDRFRLLLNSNGSMCLCNVIMADPHLRPYINGTIDTVRMYALPFTCSAGVPLQLIACLCKYI
jgi:hypothetical protein